MAISVSLLGDGGFWTTIKTGLPSLPSLNPAVAAQIAPSIQIPDAGLVPGAAALPATVGRKLTIRNAVIGGTLVLAGYVVYTLLSPKKAKPAAPSPAIAGLFRRRRRRS